MNNKKNYKLTVNDLPQDIPDYKNSDLPKDILTAKWLSEWIKDGKEGYILPSKKILASYLGISSGTVENAIRYLEDDGLLGSKQRTGTFITGTKIKKQTSKREIIVRKLEKYIIENGIGHVMPTIKKMSEIFQISQNTMRLAYIYLISKNILCCSKDNQKILTVNKLPDTKNEEEKNSLTDKITEDLTEYIKKNFKKGDVIPPRSQLSEIFKVSIKTIHDGIKILERKGILLSLRGKYGTIVTKIPEDENVMPQSNEYSIFAKSRVATQYRWKKIEKKIKALIREYYEPGSKLPSMDSLAQNFDVSTNTIRNALKKLSSEGWIEFERGRYGGTFVVNIPENSEQNIYEWVAIAQNSNSHKSSF